MPGLLPAAVAATLALILAPGDAAPVAYVAGVAGPLIGADLSTSRRSSRAPSVWPASAGPELSTASFSRA